MKSSPSSIFIISLVVLVGICNAAKVDNAAVQAFTECVKGYIETVSNSEDYTARPNTVEESLQNYIYICRRVTDEFYLATESSVVLDATLPNFPWSKKVEFVQTATTTLCRCVQDNCGGYFRGGQMPCKGKFLNYYAQSLVGSNLLINANATFDEMCPAGPNINN